MLHSSAPWVEYVRGATDRSANRAEVEQPAPSPNYRRRHSCRPAVLVVQSRSHVTRFRIVTAPLAPLPTDLPVSFPYSGHRTCQKAMDCHVDETSDRNQR